MREAVPAISYGRRHVDNSFDQLGLLHVGHRVVAALELVAGQVVAVLELRDYLDVLRDRNSLGGSSHHMLSR